MFDQVVNVCILARSNAMSDTYALLLVLVFILCFQKRKT